MQKITRESLMTLEAYAKARPEFRSQLMRHKKARSVRLGEHITLIFEDELTMRYQVQEMLRAERIFESEGIQDEIDAYNPLIPDGGNWKATMMIEYPDIDERTLMLSRMKGIETRVWVQVADFERVSPFADEDLERENDEKTASVHFLRFELTAGMIHAVKQGAAITMGVEHPAYTAESGMLPELTRASLVADLG
jgi:hypothetical protein